jgi:hypothetical protein
LALFPAPSGGAPLDIGDLMKKAGPAVLGVLVLLVATACGGDDAKDQLTATITTNVAKAISTPDGILDSGEAGCVAKKFVGDLGTEKLQAAQVVTEDGSYNENGANVDATTSAAYAEALLSCVDEDEATEKIEKILVEGTSGNQISAKNAKCYISKLVESVDIEGLLSSRIVVDSGELNQNAPDYTEETAAKSTAALLGCVDYYALDAQQRASQTKGLSAAKYAACMRKKLPEKVLGEFLTAVQAETAQMQALSTRISAATEACSKTATAK